MAENAYAEIMDLRGFEEFKDLAKRLCQLSESRRTLQGTHVRVPNFLFAEAPGAGVTTQIRLLTRLLMEQRLIRFMGEKRCFEWVLDEHAFEQGGSFDRLLMEVNAAAGFYSQFRGVIGIELDRWVKRADDPKLTRLTDFVSDMFGQIVFVFVVEKQADDKLAALHRVLSAATPVMLVHCPLPGAREMAAYLTDFLSQRGFGATQEAVAAMEGFMPELMRTRGFDGLQTVSNLADEIVFRACTGLSPAGEFSGQALVRPEDLAFVTQSGGFIDRFGKDDRQHSRIGFERVG